MFELVGDQLSFSKAIPLTPKLKKVTFSQSYKEKCISEVVRIGGMIIFHLSKPYEKPSS